MELSSFFDGGEGLFDGVEIGAVGRQRQKDVTFCLENVLDLLFVVEGSVVHDDDAGLIEFG